MTKKQLRATSKRNQTYPIIRGGGKYQTYRLESRAAFQLNESGRVDDSFVPRAEVKTALRKLYRPSHAEIGQEITIRVFNRSSFSDRLVTKREKGGINVGCNRFRKTATRGLLRWVGLRPSLVNN